MGLGLGLGLGFGVRVRVRDRDGVRVRVSVRVRVRVRVRVNPPLQECIRLGATHAAIVVVHGGPRGVSGARRQADVGAWLRIGSG